MNLLLQEAAGRTFRAMLLLALVAGASQAATNEIYFLNDTDESICTAVGFRRPNGDWVFNGYWTIDPGEYAYVANPINRAVFVWATAYGSGTTWKGNYNYQVRRDGVYRPFRKWVTPAKWGTYTYRFHY